jgi:hypothetical protein
MAFFETDPHSAAAAIEQAQHIAFAPMVFQAARALRTLGILAYLDQSGGATQAQVVEHTGLSEYGVRVLLEAGLGIRLVTCRDHVYHLSKTGWFILHDKMTIVNMDFSHDVCYAGMASLDEAVTTGTPAGLRALGDWRNIYQGLHELAPTAKHSWYAFDHFYSDDAYSAVLPIINRFNPRAILDIGANTGRFALQCLRHDPARRVGLVDLPPMIRATTASLTAQGFGDRITGHPTDMLDPSQSLPTGYDAMWMSQFLDCFSESEIVEILRKVHAAASDESVVFIMEPFWDRQRREIAAFCLQMTSLYFTGLANGNSQMYESGLFLSLIAKAGLKIVEQIDNIGVCQTLLICRKA